MSKSIPIVLTATTISFGNEWIQTEQVNFRVLVAGLAASLFLDGVEHISEPIGTGLATLMLVSVLLTPFNGNSPVGTLANYTQKKPVTHPRKA